MYLFLDYFFVVFHGSLVLFNLTGWIWKLTRKLHLITISITLLSWVGLGLFYGFGYCPCTDWHWQVKRKLGETELPYSYIKYYADKLTGIDWDPFLVDALTLISALAAFGLSCWMNWKEYKKSKEDKCFRSLVRRGKS